MLVTLTTHYSENLMLIGSVVVVDHILEGIRCALFAGAAARRALILCQSHTSVLIGPFRFHSDEISRCLMVEIKDFVLKTGARPDGGSHGSDAAPSIVAELQLAILTGLFPLGILTGLFQDYTHWAFSFG